MQILKNTAYLCLLSPHDKYISLEEWRVYDVVIWEYLQELEISNYGINHNTQWEKLGF